MVLPPDEPNDEEKLEELEEDNETPFRPADDTNQRAGSLDDSGIATPIDTSLVPASSDGSVSSTYPTTDTDVDDQEDYDEGLSGATETSDPSADNTVTKYTPPEKDLTGEDRH